MTENMSKGKTIHIVLSTINKVWDISCGLMGGEC